MEKEALGSINFLDTILQDAEAQAAHIVAEATQLQEKKSANAKSLIETFQKEAEARFSEEKQRLLKNQKNNIEMEQKRFELSLRDRIISESIQAALKKVKEAAAAPSYPSVVRQLIFEAVMGIGKTELRVSVSPLEASLVTQPFLNQLAADFSAEVGTPLTLSLDSKRLRKQGVAVSDAEGRVAYDNQFETRLIRYQSHIRKVVYRVIAEEVGNGK